MLPLRITGAQIPSSRGAEVGDITIADGRIHSTHEGSAIIDGSGLIASAGFVDLQINGGFGLDLYDDPTSMWELGRHLPRHGVTAFLPTIVSSPPDIRRRALDSFHSRPPDHRGAEPLGLHLEGPILSPERRGAHRLEHLAEADSDFTEEWSRTNGVVMVTIAPELLGAPALIAKLVSQGVTVSAGHTNATAEEARAGFAAGVTAVTHLYNAMAPFGHRSPNLVGMALADPGVVGGIIVDGVHVDPVVVAATWHAKGPEGLALVTDAVAPMGQPPGVYEFAGMDVDAAHGGVRNSDGVLAGSTLTMDQALRNLVTFTGCDPHEALISATATPADLIGAKGRGRIAEGAIADIVLLNQALEVQVTICAGVVAYVAEGARGRVSTQLLEIE